MCELERYEKLERDIINERPYNPYKHFLFNLPEILATVLKFAFYVGIAYVVVTATLQATAEMVPTLCERYNSLEVIE